VKRRERISDSVGLVVAIAFCITKIYIRRLCPAWAARRSAQAAPVPLRGDYDAAARRRLARSPHDPGMVRRLLTVAAIYDGELRSKAAPPPMT
jgi:hypothetical protein